MIAIPNTREELKQLEKENNIIVKLNNSQSNNKVISQNKNAFDLRNKVNSTNQNQIIQQNKDSTNKDNNAYNKKKMSIGEKVKNFVGNIFKSNKAKKANTTTSNEIVKEEDNSSNDNYMKLSNKEDEDL